MYVYLVELVGSNEENPEVFATLEGAMAAYEWIEGWEHKTGDGWEEWQQPDPHGLYDTYVISRVEVGP